MAINYINSSASGFLDTRLFHIAQSWELLAHAWEVQGELPPAMADLRSRLQSARRQWGDEHQNSDADGFWGSRIGAIFTWTKLKDTVERLASSYQIDFQRHGLELNDLVSARDNVAHSGRLPEELLGRDRKAVSLLLTGQYCLQLLLLRILQYQGLVVSAKQGWRIHVPMELALVRRRDLGT